MRIKYKMKHFTNKSAFTYTGINIHGEFKSAFIKSR